MGLRHPVVCICVDVHTFISTCKNLCVQIYVYVYINMSVFKNPSIHMDTSLYNCTFTHMYMLHMYIRMYVYICTHK